MMLTYPEISSLVLILVIGMVATFKTVKYILRFLYLNNNRSTLYHLSLSDPMSYNAQKDLGYVQGLQDIPACSMRLMMWAVIACVNAYVFTFWLFWIFKG